MVSLATQAVVVAVFAIISYRVISQTCPTANGRYPCVHHCQCYFKCYNGIPMQKWCPPGQMFDVLSMSCTYYDKAVCTKNIWKQIAQQTMNGNRIFQPSYSDGYRQKLMANAPSESNVNSNLMHVTLAFAKPNYQQGMMNGGMMQPGMMPQMNMQGMTGGGGNGNMMTNSSQDAMMQMMQMMLQALMQKYQQNNQSTGGGGSAGAGGGMSCPNCSPQSSQQIVYNYHLEIPPLKIKFFR